MELSVLSLLFPFLLLHLHLLLLLLLAHGQSSIDGGSFTPADSYLLDCGGAPQNLTIDGKVWQSDKDSHFLSSEKHVIATSPASPNTTNRAPVEQSLFLTSSIFPSTSTYTFPLSAPGRVWLRLYFAPFVFESYDPSTTFFSVAAAGFLLLSDFNAVDALRIGPAPTPVPAPGPGPVNPVPPASFIMKEYLINVTSSPSLSVTFVPTKGKSAHPFAFVNAIQVVSAPAALIMDNASPFGVNTPIAMGLNTFALELVHRVNVGGPLVTAANDTLGRMWKPNSSYLVSPPSDIKILDAPLESIKYGTAPAYIAPRIVYASAIQTAFLDNTTSTQGSLNISWAFPICAGFLYLVRLHFAEISGIGMGMRLFNVYLQNQTAYWGIDLYAVAKGANTAYYHDITLNGTGAAGIETMIWLQIGPVLNEFGNSGGAILNGIEIFKANNSANSLDGAIDTAGILAGIEASKTNIGAIVGGVVGGVAIIGLASWAIFMYRQPKTKAPAHTSSPAWQALPMHGNSASIGSKVSHTSHKSATVSYISSVTTALGRNFTFNEIKEATNNFNEADVVGVGGFGKVYKGELDDGTKVAVKRGNPKSDQGIVEFQTEIDLLSKLRHRHLVSLIGYCEEHSEMILVYEYMSNGPLRSHIYGSDLPTLSWKQRLEICIGSARGLHYLHTGAAQGIIHRDVKTTNILLDENFIAKVADFGLSKTGPNLEQTHVSTAVKGSFGYLDPEYFRRQQLTEKSDVYSFGVVLMEVLCARPAINPALPREQVNIAEWALNHHRKGALEKIIDPKLQGQINKDSLKKFGDTAEKCLADAGTSRPSMGDVLWNLEFALQLQETALAEDQNASNISPNQVMEAPLRLHAQEPLPWDDSIAVEEGSDDATASQVFSQLVNSQGR